MKFRAASLSILPIVLFGCSVAPDETELLGEARIALTNIPSDVQCVRISVVGARTVERNFDVGAGQTAEYALVGLPLGSVLVLGDAFETACSAVNASTPMAWTSEPVSTVLTSGVVPDITLFMRPGARGKVKLDFETKVTGKPPIFSPPQVSLVNRPRAGVAGDLDRDGRPDLALVSDDNSALVTLLNNGGGSFRVAAMQSVFGGFLGTLALGDFEPDGQLDVAMTGGGAGVRLFRGDGSGNFMLFSNISAGATPFGIVSEHLNGDSLLDLAVANFSSNDVTVLSATGGLQFARTSNPPAGTSPVAIKAGDATGDGLMDLVALNGGNNDAFTLLRGNGSGTFVPQGTVSLGGRGVDLALGDVDSDGSLDVITVDPNVNPGVVRVHHGTGNGNFARVTLHPVAGNVSVAVRVADLNRDDILDIVTADEQSGLSVLVGTGGGNFNAPLSFAVPQPREIIISDVNVDGRPDIIALSYFSDSVHVLLNGT